MNQVAGSLDLGVSDLRDIIKRRRKDTEVAENIQIIEPYEAWPEPVVLRDLVDELLIVITYYNPAG